MLYNNYLSIPYYETYPVRAPHHANTLSKPSSSGYTVCYHNGVAYSPGATACIDGITKECQSNGTWENAGLGSCLSGQPNLVPFLTLANPCQGVGFQPGFIPVRPGTQVITSDEMKKCKDYWTYLWTKDAQGWILIRDISDENVYGCVWVWINGQWSLQYGYVPINTIVNYYYIIQ